MDLEHHIFLMLLDGDLHLSPVKDPQRILDLGTGTGIWAIDTADKYPSASVVGTDLSPVQPSLYVPYLMNKLTTASPRISSSRSTTLKTSGPFALALLISSTAV